MSLLPGHQSCSEIDCLALRLPLSVSLHPPQLSFYPQALPCPSSLVPGWRSHQVQHESPGFRMKVCVPVASPPTPGHSLHRPWVSLPNVPQGPLLMLVCHFLLFLPGGLSSPDLLGEATTRSRYVTWTDSGPLLEQERY